MKKKLLSLLTCLTLAVGVVAPLNVSAAGVDVFSGACPGGSGSTTGTGGGAGTGTAAASSSDAICGATGQGEFEAIMTNIINTILIVLGMIAVIMIIVGGIRYTTSNGDSSQIQSAKNTIMYAVIGLVVAILSFAIVNFVIGAFL